MSAADGGSSAAGKTVWITGAWGFLGGWCVRSFAAQGWTPVALGRGAAWAPDGAAAVFPGDLTAETLAEVRRVAGDPDAIVHAAGGASVGRSLEDPVGDFSTTLPAWMAVLDAARRCDRPPATVLVSSAAVYGAGSDGPLTEDAPRTPASPYGLYKAMAEDALAYWSSRYGVPGAAVRLFSVYGPGLRKQLLWDFAVRALGGEAPLVLSGTGQERRDFIHAEDAAELLRRAVALASTHAPVINGGGGRGVTVRELAESYVRALDVPIAVTFNGRVRAGDPPSLVADVARATGIGFTPRWTLQAGLAQYAAWAKDAVSAPTDRTV